MKNFVVFFRYFLRLFGNRSCGDRAIQTLAVERLEPRILYSAAPAPTDVPEPAGDPVPEASTEASAAVPTPQAAPVPAEPTAVAAPEAAEGEGEISGEAQVDLVDVGNASAALNQEVVETLAAEARQRWIDSGISADQIAALDEIDYTIADVGGAHLGVADGFSITIDDDAGGTGVGNWFIDATPWDDAEFGGNISAASGRYDLLSTLIHEQGHVLGLGDIFGQRDNVMGGLLDAGTRRLPTVGQAEGAVAGSLSGSNYLQAHIVRASLDANGVEGNGHSNTPALSADGRFVAFISQADNLVAGDNNSVADVFVKDLVTGEIVRASTDSNGIEGNGTNARVSISADGRYVVFESVSTNLVADDTNSATDVFLKDLWTGETSRVSVDRNGTEGDGASRSAQISANGRYVVFGSQATTLLAGDTDATNDIYLKDLKTGKLSLISAARDGTKGDAASYDPSISADGRYIAFDSFADNFGPTDANGFYDVYVKDRKTGAVMLASSNGEGTTPGNAYSESSMISANGKFVVFGSFASNFTDAPDNGEFDLYVKNLETGAITRVNLDQNGGEAAGGIGFGRPSISGDGRFVVFSSDSTELQSYFDPHGLHDVFLKDMETGRIQFVSSTASGQLPTGSSAIAQSRDAVISADGKFVAFSTGADNLVDDDTNGDTDIFVKAVASVTQDSGLSISIDPFSGDLEVDDQTSGADNRISIGIVDGKLEIRDKKAAIVNGIVGGEQPDEHTLLVDLSLFSGDIEVELGNGDDRVDIGDLIGLPGGISINGDNGFDQINQKGTIMLTGASSISFEADQIKLGKGSLLQTEDGGIDLGEDNRPDPVKERRYTGLIGRGASIVSESGRIYIDTEGGQKGSGNVGVDLANTEVRVGAGGSVSIEAEGGDGRSQNVGIILRRGTSISGAAGSGSLYLDGEGGGDGNGNGGLRIDSGVEIDWNGGFVGLDGDGALGRSGNYGLRFGNATITSAGSGNVNISATGGGSGSGNHGAILTGTVLQTTGTGNVDVLVRGSNSGLSGQGLILKGAALMAMGTAGSVEITGLGRGTRSSAIGFNASRSTLESANGEVQITAYSQAGANEPEPAKNNNIGGRIVGSTITAATNVEILARSGSGNNGNTALVMRSSDIHAGGNVTIEAGVYNFGTPLLTQGSNNRGVDLNRVDITAASVMIDGRDGGGKNNNDGVRIRSGQISTASGNVDIAATSLTAATHTGNGNGGVNLSRVMIGSAGDIDIDGQAGAGKNRNAAVKIVGSTLIADGGKVDIDGVGNAASTGKDNHGVQLNKTDIEAQGNVELDASGGGGTDRNVAIDIRRGSVTARTGDLNIVGLADAATTGSRNVGVQIAGAAISANASDLLILSTGGGGLNDNRGLSIIGSTLSANNGSGVVGVYGTARNTTTGVRNIGNYLFNKVVLDGSAEIGGSGGGGTALNHGIYAHRKITANDIIYLDGTAGAGEGSEDEAGDFLEVMN